jgi:hypothetical protein
MFKFTKLFPLFGLLVLAPPAPSPSLAWPFGNEAGGERQHSLGAVSLHVFGQGYGF